MVTGFVQGLDPDERIYKKRFKDISVEKTNSFVRVLASDSSRLDGYNCSCGVIDEYHSAPDTRVRDVIRSSQGMREQPMMWTITTAGFDKTSVCWDLRVVASEIISGVKIDESFFSVIYCLDDEDDWADPKVWKKSNPNLGVTVNKAFIEREVLQAKNSPADEVGVRTKNLNQWMDSNTTWIPDDYLIKAQMDIPYEFFKDRSEPTFCGVDLASNVDLTACTYLYVSGDTYYFKSDYYIPMDTIKNGVNVDKELYKEWVYHKYLKTTSGNVTDYEYITKDLLYMNSLNEIHSIFFDKWNSNQWAVSATDQGLNPVPFSQTIGNFNNATKEIERLILSGKVFMDNNPISRYCFRNVSIKQDFNGNIKPVKSAEKKKIDGTISIIQALASFMEYKQNYKGIGIY
jgi:phage terminase large subunit-like protein